MTSRQPIPINVMAAQAAIHGAITKYSREIGSKSNDTLLSRGMSGRLRGHDVRVSGHAFTLPHIHSVTRDDGPATIPFIVMATQAAIHDAITKHSREIDSKASARFYREE